MTDKIPMTKNGHAKLKEELVHLKRYERPKVIQDISSAREHGDLKENAEYAAAKEKQSFIEGRIRHVEDRLARAQVIDTSKLSNEKVVFGATVEIVNIEDDSERKYTIVGADESDIDSGKISITSPIARGLIGNSVGDLITVKAPDGLIEYEIENIYFE